MRIGLISVIVGFFLIRSQVENIVTEYIPGNLEIPLGIGLIIYGLYIMKERGTKLF